MQTNPYSPPSAVQPDPTNVMGRRIAAYLIDALLFAVVYSIAAASILDSVTLPSSRAATNLCDVVNSSPDSSICINLGSTVYAGTGSDVAVLSLLILAFLLVFHVVLPTLTGFSPGKGVMGLRVVKQDTMQTAGLGANLVRWLLWIVDAFPYCLPLVGLITGLASSNHRRVGDMAASTIVVHKNSVGQVREPAPATTNWTPPAPTMPVAPPPSTPAPSAPPSSAPGSPFSPPASTTGAPPPPPGNWKPPAPSPQPVAEVAEPQSEATGPDPEPQTAAEPESESAETPSSRPGIDAPQWDEARNTYIQWDPDLQQWMEWNEGQGRWVPISR